MGFTFVCNEFGWRFPGWPEDLTKRIGHVIARLAFQWLHPHVFGEGIDDQQDVFVAIVPLGKFDEINQIRHPQVMFSSANDMIPLETAPDWFM